MTVMGLEQMEGGGKERKGCYGSYLQRKARLGSAPGLALAAKLCFKWVTRVQHIRCCCKGDEFLLSVKEGCL